MERYIGFLEQAKVMRDALVEKATKAANDWLEATKKMLESMPDVGIGAIGPAKEGESATSKTKPSLAKQIRTFIASRLGHEFTSNNVRDFLIAQGIKMSPSRRAGISTILGRLAKKGMIELVEKGAGSAPSRYFVKEK